MTISVSDLPAVNASLNTTSAVLLCFGFYFIRRKRITAHKRCMLSAFIVSTVFLVGYIVYHSFHGRTTFTGQGWIRPVYFTILLTHTVLAIAMVPLILAALYYALRAKFEQHKKIVRWTWPIWFYVSVTGVVVYAVLYHLYPSR